MDNLTSTPKRSKVLLTVQILVGLFYGMIVLGGIIAPLVYRLIIGDWSDTYYATAELMFMMCTMATVGMVVMYLSLRSVKDRLAVEIWTMVAVGVAPISSYFYMGFFSYLRILFSPFFSCPNLFFYSFGFYLPFVLLVIWVRYRCREDEF